MGFHDSWWNMLYVKFGDYSVSGFLDNLRWNRQTHKRRWKHYPRYCFRHEQWC